MIAALLNRLGLREKWALGASILVAAGSVFAFAYFPGRVQDDATASLRARGESVAEVTAFAVAPMLFFEDAVSARKALEGALRVDDVLRVAARGLNGFTVQIHRETPDAEAELLAEDFEVIETEIVRGSETLGVLQVQLSRATLRRQVSAAQHRIGLLCLGFAFIGALGAWGLSGLVTGPLGQIADAADEIADGDFARRAPVLGNDEVGRFAVSFNAMVDRLQAAQTELREINASLEARVAENTRELREQMEERRKAEESLMLVATALDQADEILMVLAPDGTIEYVNAAYERARGVVAAEFVGKNVWEQAVRELEPGVIADMQRTLAAGATWLGAIPRSRPTGEDYLQRTQIVPVRDEDGTPTRFVVSGQDATRELELEDQLRQSQKMEAVGQLAGGIAHDFNNLLAAIKGYCELLMLSPVAETADREALEEISRAADRAATLTGQLLAFGRRQILHPEPLSPADVVHSMKGMLERLISKGIRLDVVADTTDPTIVVDRSQLEQVLINLVINARDAIGSRGTIRLEVVRESSVRAPVDWSADGPEVVRISVADDGCGITEDVLEQIFEPFYTTKEVGKGTGLGLSTVYGIVQQSGGAITVESEPGVGTTFHIYFPLAPDSEGEPPDAGSRGDTPDPNSPSGSRILVADDEPIVRKLVRRQLEQAGFEVREAADGEHAWHILEEHDGAFDMLLSDIRMPYLDGLALAGRVRESYPDMKVLLMSGFTGSLEDGEGPEDPEILAKPFTRDELLFALDAAEAVRPGKRT